MKSYFAKRHDIKREKQKNNSDEVHHPEDKIKQINNVLRGKNHKILELFAGQGNLTKVYNNYGAVDTYDRKWLKTGDSYIIFHKLISEKKKYTIIDLDPYGFPNRFFPDIFLLIENGFMFITMPKPFVNILNAMTQQHLTCYFGESNPDLDTILERLDLYGLCHWRKLKLLNVLNLDSKVWRLAFRVKRVKATEYCGVRNR